MAARSAAATRNWQAAHHDVVNNLQRCLEWTRFQPPESKQRALLQHSLEDLQQWASRFSLEGLAATSSDNSRVGAACLLAVLGNALTACVLLIALLQDSLADSSWGGCGRRDASCWFHVAFRAEAHRLRALRVLLPLALPGGSKSSAEMDWDPTRVLVSASLARLWRGYFGEETAVRFDKLLAALSATYEPLTEREVEAIREFLDGEYNSMVSMSDAALLFDGPGVWRGALFCSSWPELASKPLLQAIVSGGVDRHLAMTACDLATERQQKQQSALLVGWSRAGLARDHAALHLLRTLGMTVAADAPDGAGLLVHFSLPCTAKYLMQHASVTRRACEDLLGEGVLRCQPVIADSLARSIALCVTDFFELRDARARHMTLALLHRRKLFEGQDDAEELLMLQQEHSELLQTRINNASDGQSSGALRSCAFGQGTNHTANSRELLAQRRVAQQASQLLQHELADVASQSTLAATLAAPVQDQLMQLEHDIEFGAQEHVLIAAINSCIRRQIATRLELADIEAALVQLEGHFATLRQKLLEREADLTGHISGVEQELATLGDTLAQKREGTRAAADAVLDARLELAELMVPLPTQLHAPLEVAEAKYTAEVAALKSRVEDLQKRYVRAKAAAKKR